MDDIDRRILEELARDASAPLKSLAAAVGLSRSAVQERIARLRAGGVIRRYTVEIAAPAAVRAVLMVRLVRTPSPALVARVCAMVEVARVASLSGPIDLLVEVVAADVATVNRVRDAIASDAAVADLETAFVLKQDKAPI